MKQNRSLHGVRFWDLVVGSMCVALVLAFGSVGSFRLFALLVQVLVLYCCLCGARCFWFGVQLSNNGINLTP